MIISEENNTLYVMTNYHVVEGAKEVSVQFSDETTATATVKGYDEDKDVAVLTIDMSQLSDDTKKAIAVMVMGDSDQLKAGESAIAIGNALGYGQSVTTGVISAVNREVALTDKTMTLLQTSAAINPGNSGGALLNGKGEVIGMNTVKYSDTSVEGMGYAIPINTALETAKGIIDGTIRQRHSLVLQAVHLMKIRHLPIMHQPVSMSATWHLVPLHSVQVCRQDALLPDSMVKMFPQWKTFRN